MINTLYGIPFLLNNLGKNNALWGSGYYAFWIPSLGVYEYPPLVNPDERVSLWIG
jgi:hypothetical protein